MTAKGKPLLLPFYFVADQTGRPLADVRSLPAGEFFSWLNYHGFPRVLEDSK